MVKIKDYKYILIIIFLCLVFFMLGNGILSLTNPDEVFYAQTAKEMKQQGTWFVPYLFGQPQFEKPILTYWLLRIAFILFGVSNFAARFFPALFAMFGVIAVYYLSLYAFKEGQKKAFLCSLVLMSSGFYIGMARTVFTDMIFSVLIILALTTFFLGHISSIRKSLSILLFFIFSALAVLTKGPLGFFIPTLIVFLFLAARKDLKFLFSKFTVFGLLIFLLISLPWYIFMIERFGNGFIREFFYNDHIRRIIMAEHGNYDRWYFYPASAILCMFPWSLYVVAAIICFARKLKKTYSNPIYLFLTCWILVVFVIFQSAHSKLASYILPLIPALAILTGDFIYDRLEPGKAKSGGIFIISLISTLILLSVPMGLIVSAGKYSLYLPARPLLNNVIAAYVLILLIMFYFVLSRRLLLNIFVLAFQVLLLLSFAVIMHKNFEGYVSSKEACDYLLKNYAVSNTIICSKPFVRGVRYYTDKDVAVMHVRGINFFSPHPIPFLDSDSAVRDFLKTQPITYGVLNKSSLAYIKQISIFKIRGVFRHKHNLHRPLPKP